MMVVFRYSEAGRQAQASVGFPAPPWRLALIPISRKKPLSLLVAAQSWGSHRCSLQGQRQGFMMPQFENVCPRSCVDCFLAASDIHASAFSVQGGAAAQ